MQGKRQAEWPFSDTAIRLRTEADYLEGPGMPAEAVRHDHWHRQVPAQSMASGTDCVCCIELHKVFRGTSGAALQGGCTPKQQRLVGQTQPLCHLAPAFTLLGADRWVVGGGGGGVCGT